MTEILHYFGLICLAASLLMRILPAPCEINSKAYAIVYGIIRRASLNMPPPPSSGAIQRECAPVIGASACDSPPDPLNADPKKG